ncbi:MAG: zinc metallopeptidase, partial [Eubacteriales bacterium]|nr:zinc metallopeptidase [Eubacteriales bacterium]
TLLLGGSALIFACIISIPLGIYTALHQNTWKDTAAMIVALFGVSMPNFWLGLMLILLFSLKFGLLPSGGTGGFQYLILPAVTVGLGLAASLTRTTRSAMLDVLRQDYMTTAKAKGASRNRVIYNHGLRNAIIPVCNIGSAAGIPLALIGIFLNISGLVYFGLILYAFVALFQFVTLPVELDASHRALKVIDETKMLEGNEYTGARKVLTAAAMTYVVAVATALANLLRFIIVFLGNSRRSS